MVGVLNDQGVGVGDVDARLDDGGAHQHVHLAVAHAGHHVVELLLAHLAVGHRHSHVLPQHLLDAGGGAGDGLHPVVEVVHLAAPLQLPAHGVGEHPPVVLQHIGLHRLAVHGRLLQGGHVPDAGEGHIQRPGDGGGGEGEHVHLLGQLLELLLVLDAEALLLVDDQQAQILKFHVLLEEAVGADEQIDAPLLQPPQGVLHLGLGAEAADHVDLHRVLGKALLGRQVVLPGQHGGGHQDGGLFAVQHTLHDGPEGHLRLAVAHVAAQQPVHGPGLFHILLDLGDAAELIVGFGVLELVLKLLHPGGIGGEGEAGLALPLGIELNEPLGQILDGLLGPGLGLLPVGAPQPGELAGLLGVLPGADVLAHQVELGGGDVEHVGPGVGDLDVVLLHPVHRHLGHLQEAAHAVVLVYHQVAGRQVGVGAQLLPVGHRLAPALFAQQGLPLGEHGEAPHRVLHAGGEPPHGNHRLAVAGQLVELEIHGGGHLLLPQEGLEVEGTLLAAHQYHGAESVGDIVGQVGDGGLQAGAVRGELLGQQVEQGAGPLGVPGGGEGVQVADRPVGQHLGQLLKGAGEVSQLPGQLSPLHQGLGVLSQLPQVALSPLGHPGALAEHHHRVLGEVIRRRGHDGVDQGYVAVHGREGRAGRQPLPVLLQRLHQCLAPLAALCLGNETVQPLQQPAVPARGKLGQHLRRRQDLRRAEILDAPLGVGIEEAHGVDLVPEELHPDGLGVGRGEKVQDAPPQGELAHALHLLAAGVARGGQGAGQLPQVVPLSHPQNLGRLGQQGFGNGALENGLHRTDQQGALPRRQGPQGGQPPVLVLPGHHRGVVEGELPGRECAHLLPRQGGQIPGHALGLPLVGAHHHHGAVQLLADARGKMGAVHRRQPGKGRRTGPVVDGRQQGAVFRYVVEGGEQWLHRTPRHRKDRKLWARAVRRPGVGWAAGSLRGKSSSAAPGRPPRQRYTGSPGRRESPAFDTSHRPPYSPAPHGGRAPAPPCVPS